MQPPPPGQTQLEDFPPVEPPPGQTQAEELLGAAVEAEVVPGYRVPNHMIVNNVWDWAVNKKGPRSTCKTHFLTYMRLELVEDRLKQLVAQDGMTQKGADYIKNNLLSRKYMDYPSQAPTDPMMEAFTVDCLARLKFCV